MIVLKNIVTGKYLKTLRFLETVDTDNLYEANKYQDFPWLVLEGYKNISYEKELRKLKLAKLRKL